MYAPFCLCCFIIPVHLSIVNRFSQKTKAVPTRCTRQRLCSAEEPVTVREYGVYIRTVKNNPGIPEEDRKHIFKQLMVSFNGAASRKKGNHKEGILSGAEMEADGGDLSLRRRIPQIFLPLAYGGSL